MSLIHVSTECETTERALFISYTAYNHYKYTNILVVVAYNVLNALNLLLILDLRGSFYLFFFIRSITTVLSSFFPLLPSFLFFVPFAVLFSWHFKPINRLLKYFFVVAFEYFGFSSFSLLLRNVCMFGFHDMRG